MHVILTGNTTFKLANFRHGLIRQLIKFGHRVTIVAPPDSYVEQVVDMGCHFVPIKMERNGTSIISEAILLKNVYLTIRSLNPDAVFSYTIKNNLYFGICCRLFGKPFFPNVTGLGPAFNERGALSTAIRFMYRQSFKKAKKVFFQNSSDLETFLELGISQNNQAHLLPGSGVDLDKFIMRKFPEKKEGDEIVFLLVARMLWEKGVGIFADAAREVKRIYPNFRFVLLGPVDADSKSSIPYEKIKDWVEKGYVEYNGSTKNVLPHLYAADCVVLPSYYREGTPRSLLEAGATGLPIITTDMPGCRDVVKDGVNGYLIKPNDIKELSDALIRFALLDPHARQEMGNCSRDLIESRYDEKIVISSYISELDKL